MSFISENPYLSAVSPSGETLCAIPLGLFLATACAFPIGGDRGLGTEGNDGKEPRLSTQFTQGPVVAVGGGGTPREAIREMIRLGRARLNKFPGAVSSPPNGVEAGEAPLDVVVIPYASGREERGVASAAMWLEEGASTAVLSPNDAQAAAALLAEAEVLWMGGGDQRRLLDDLERMGLVDDVLRAHARGAVVGGTSAGAAVLGSVCIAGDPSPHPYESGAMAGRPGLGLVPDAIIDQHFRERRREGRLLTAVLDAGGLCGYGISESTALFFHGEHMTVMGEGVVVVFDATDATFTNDGLGASDPWRAERITTGILAPDGPP